MSSSEPVEVTASDLAEMALFRRLPRAALEVIAPRISYLVIKSEQTLLDKRPGADIDSSVFVLLEGDVSVRRLQVGARWEIVNFIRAGEAYVQGLFADPQTERLRLNTISRVRALQLPYRDVEALLTRFPDFRADLGLAVRPVTDRQVRRFDEEAQKEVARFLVEERLTIAGRVKIKRMDICIECDACHVACRDRHGTDRLGPSLKRHGLAAIPASCHDCVVPDCIDSCRFGTLVIDPETREIVIEDDCTGCGACVRACSYDVIRMHRLNEVDVGRYFPDRSPTAKGKAIAQKCDNCAGFDDQACITACPTGAIFEVEGGSLFDAWPQLETHRAPRPQAVPSPASVGSGWARLAWVAVVINTVVLLWEGIGRSFAPQVTFTQLLFRVGLLESGLEPTATYRPGDAFSHPLGYVGGALLVATQLYRIGKRMAPRWGNLQPWLELHVLVGLTGGIYGLFHTAFRPGGVISLALFITMGVAIATGFAGRQVLTWVARRQARVELERGRVGATIERLGREIERGLPDPRVADRIVVRINQVVAGVATDGRPPSKAKAPRGKIKGSGDEEQRSLGEAIRALARQRKIHDQLVDQLGSELVDDRLAAGHVAALVGHLREMAGFVRSIRRLAVTGEILKRYRIVHVVAAHIMFGALAFHVAWSLVFRVGN